MKDKSKERRSKRDSATIEDRTGHGNRLDIVHVSYLKRILVTGGGNIDNQPVTYSSGKKKTTERDNPSNRNEEKNPLFNNATDGRRKDRCPFQIISSTTKNIIDIMAFQ